MARMTSRFASLAAIAAALSLAATPASARDWHRHHRDGVDGGDILAGALIIGGIAAIASAASKSKRDREIREDRYPNPEPYPQERYDYRAPPPAHDYQAGGINDAVNSCAGEVERGDARVASVDNASRSEDGWRVAGQLEAGGGFNCWIDNDGRIRSVDLGETYYEGASASEPAGEQWDDEAYASARSEADTGNSDEEIDGDVAYSGN